MDSHYPRCQGISEVKEYVYLYPGEYHFACEPTLIHTVLGSCVSVILFDRKNRYGSMCHAVLDSNPYHEDSATCSKFMDCVIDEMIQKFSEQKIDVQSLVVKVFGGASMLDKGPLASPTAQPGVKNILMARKILEEYGCTIDAEDCGGYRGRKIYFCSHSGEVFLKRIKKS